MRAFSHYGHELGEMVPRPDARQAKYDIDGASVGWT